MMRLFSIACEDLSSAAIHAALQSALKKILDNGEITALDILCDTDVEDVREDFEKIKQHGNIFCILFVQNELSRICNEKILKGRNPFALSLEEKCLILQINSDIAHDDRYAKILYRFYAKLFVEILGFLSNIFYYLGSEELSYADITSFSLISFGLVIFMLRSLYEYYFEYYHMTEFVYPDNCQCLYSSHYTAGNKKRICCSLMQCACCKRYECYHALSILCCGDN